MVLFRRFTIGLTIHLVKINHVSNDIYEELEKSCHCFGFYCSIRAHLERSKIVGNLICVFIMNYETIDHIVCSWIKCQLMLSLPAVSGWVLTFLVESSE
jgi:hypothetical protein